MSIRAIFSELEATRSKLEKVAILESHKNNETLQLVINAALNPYRQYYIRKTPTIIVHENIISLEHFLSELHQFEERQVTGHAARDLLELLFRGLSEDDAEVARRIIIKDLRCGMAESTATKVWPGLVPTYPKLLGYPDKPEHIKHIHYPAIVQLKEDGARGNPRCENSKVTVRSRAGKLWDFLGVFDESFLPHEGFTFDGEMVVLDKDGNVLPRKAGNGILNKAGKGTITIEEARRVRFACWDVIPNEDFDRYECDIPYHTRLAQARKFIEDGGGNGMCYMVKTQIVKSEDEARLIFHKYRQQGKEGCMLKNIDHLWRDARTTDLIKMKAIEDCDLEITGWNPGEGKFAGMVGSLICHSSDRLVVASISGMNDDKRKDITENFDSKYLGTITEVLYNEKITSKSRPGTWSLYLPRLGEHRVGEKFEADTIDEIK